MSTLLSRQDRSPNWEPEFEHIPWSDIVEAEQEGDTEKLNSLKDRSFEIRRSLSCPDRNYGYEQTYTPVPNVPHNTPLSDSRPFEEWEKEYPSLPYNISTTPSYDETVSPKAFSYADALGPRISKRTIADRTCLSPIDYLPKRSALSGYVKEPKESTLMSPTTTKIKEDIMDIGTTPDNDSRPNKAAYAAQRRLFAPAKENADPILTTKVLHSDGRSRSSSMSSVTGSSPSGHQVIQRQKQVEFGKNTLGYQRYIQTVPRWERTRDDPRTPDKNKPCSTRSWQGQIRVWRRALHKYDPPTQTGSSLFTPEEAALCHMDILKE